MYTLNAQNISRTSLTKPEARILLNYKGLLSSTKSAAHSTGVKSLSSQSLGKSNLQEVNQKSLDDNLMSLLRDDKSVTQSCNGLRR